MDYWNYAGMGQTLSTEDGRGFQIHAIEGGDPHHRSIPSFHTDYLSLNSYIEKKILFSGF